MPIFRIGMGNGHIRLLPVLLYRRTNSRKGVE
jgi:hypothetical protein